MQSDHYIEWVEAICNGKVCRRYLRPEEAPQVEFDLPAEGLHRAGVLQQAWALAGVK